MAAVPQVVADLPFVRRSGAGPGSPKSVPHAQDRRQRRQPAQPGPPAAYSWV